VQHSGAAPSGATARDPSHAGAGGSARAIALALGGLAACALVASAPGSPFQPVLPEGAGPRGPLTALATVIGLDRLAGPWAIGVGVLAMTASVAGFLVLARCAWRGGIGVRTALVLVVIATALVVFAVPLLFSRDLYSYAFYGRIGGVYGANPYVHTPVEFGTDPLWPLIGPKWVDTPAVYGPAFTTVSSGLARVVETPAGHVVAYRLLAGVASVATVLVVAATARRLRPDREAFAVVAFGLNPVVLFHAVAGGHNDVLVALAIALGFLLVVLDRPALAVGVLAVGALLKAAAALPLLLAIVWFVARAPAGRRTRTALVLGGLAAGIGVIAALPYLQTDDPTLGMLELAGHEGWLAPSVFVRKVFGWLSFGTLGWLARIVFAVLLVAVVARLAVDVWRRSAAGRPVGDVGAAMGWSVLALMLLGPVLLPWYVAWVLPLAWLLPTAPRLTTLAAAAALALAQWSTEPLRYPGAFDLNLALGHWLVTPAMLVLAIWCVVDLRRRVVGGLPLAEPERVSDAAGGERGEQRHPTGVEG
jgi:hypothetical protein